MLFEKGTGPLQGIAELPESFRPGRRRVAGEVAELSGERGEKLGVDLRRSLVTPRPASGQDRRDPSDGEKPEDAAIETTP